MATFTVQLRAEIYCSEDRDDTEYEDYTWTGFALDSTFAEENALDAFWEDHEEEEVAEVSVDYVAFEEGDDDE